MTYLAQPIGVGATDKPRAIARPAKRNHPAQKARAVALAGSVTATVALAGYMAADDGVVLTEAATQATTTVPQDTVGETESASPSQAGAGDASLALITPPEPSVLTPNALSPSGLIDGTFVGSAEPTKWGDFQVQATISGGQLVSVDVLEAPTDRKSVGINSRAVPVLVDQALSLQDANVDNVSGATWTSRAYKGSLQSALDQAVTQGART